MERFYNPRKNEESASVDSVYDPRQDSGSSGGEVSDLTPERSYDTDVRRLSADERETANRADTRNEKTQARVSTFLKAVKAASNYKQRKEVEEPMIGGKTPQQPLNINPARPGPYPAMTSLEVPSKGDKQGPVGSTNYARKPTFNFGRSFV